YADEVSRPLLHMLGSGVTELFGATTQEQLPFRDQSQPPKVMTATANLTNFPVGRRANVIRNEAGMTTTNASGHLMSFVEFCAMYRFVWSNVLWTDKLKNLPPRTKLPPEKADANINPPELRVLFTRTSSGEDVPFADNKTKDGEDDEGGFFKQKAYDRD